MFTTENDIKLFLICTKMTKHIVDKSYVPKTVN